MAGSARFEPGNLEIESMQSVEIHVKGRIDVYWSDWFGDMDITHANQNRTILTGDVVDQSALYGLIAKLRDLGLALISVNSTEMEG